MTPSSDAPLDDRATTRQQIKHTFKTHFAIHQAPFRQNIGPGSIPNSGHGVHGSFVGRRCFSNQRGNRENELRLTRF